MKPLFKESRKLVKIVRDRSESAKNMDEMVSSQLLQQWLPTEDLFEGSELRTKRTCLLEESYELAAKNHWSKAAFFFDKLQTNL